MTPSNFNFSGHPVWSSFNLSIGFFDLPIFTFLGDLKATIKYTYMFLCPYFLATEKEDPEKQQVPPPPNEGGPAIAGKKPKGQEKKGVPFRYRKTSVSAGPKDAAGLVCGKKIEDTVFAYLTHA